MLTTISSDQSLIIQHLSGLHIPQNILNKLKAIQKHAARFIVSDFHRTSSISEILKSLQWKSIEIQHKELRLMMLYKIIHEFVELPLPDYVIPAPRVTRGNSMKFVQPATSVDSYS